jgi:dTMP kinase
MKGHLITFEGIDGAGKTTISHVVYKMLQRDYDVVLTKEPTGNWTGQAVDRAVNEGLDGVTVALLFTADRNEHLKKIRSQLAKGTTVLCDRYIHSTIAYQSVYLSTIMDEPFTWVRTLHQPFYLQPTLTFLFVLDIETALKRIESRVNSPFERAEFLTQVQQLYLQLAHEESFEVLDATENVEILANKCVQMIKKKMGISNPQF